MDSVRFNQAVGFDQPAGFSQVGFNQVRFNQVRGE